MKKIYFVKLLKTFWKKLYVFIKSKIVSDEDFVKIKFKKNLDYELNLKNPKTINEKLQWLKLNDRRDLLTQCTDKYQVRSYIIKKIGKEYLIPLLYETKKPKDINKKNIVENQFVVKVNHDSGGVFIVKDNSLLDWKKLQKDLSLLLLKNYYYHSREWQYKNIEPRIIVEKLLLDENKQVPKDYKLHCFNGRVNIIQVDMDRDTNHRRNLYDTDWNLIECDWKYKRGQNQKKPSMINEMVHISEKLAKDFTYVRVDLYLIEKKIYFGELTFSSGSGWERFTPEKYDNEFGHLLKLPFE